MKSLNAWMLWGLCCVSACSPVRAPSESETPPEPLDHSDHLGGDHSGHEPHDHDPASHDPAAHDPATHDPAAGHDSHTPACPARTWCFAPSAPLDVNFIHLLANPDGALLGTSGAEESAAQASGRALWRYAEGAWTAVPTPAAALNTWVHGAAGDLWAAGYGVIWQFKAPLSAAALSAPIRYAQMIDDTRDIVYASWRSPSGQVWMVGSEGHIWRHSGRPGSQLLDRIDSPTRLTLLALFGTADNDIWAAGFLNTVLHYDGQRWSVVPEATQALAHALPLTHLRTIHGAAADDVWFAGDAGSVLRWHGGVWRAYSLNSVAQPGAEHAHASGLQGFKAVWASASDDVWLTGVGGSVGAYRQWLPDPTGGSQLWHFEGAQWQLTPLPGASAEHSHHSQVRLNAFAQSADALFAAGDQGALLRLAK